MNRAKYHAAGNGVFDPRGSRQMDSQARPPDWLPAGINRGEFPPACGKTLGGCILSVVPYICIITKQQANDDRYCRSLLFFIL